MSKFIVRAPKEKLYVEDGSPETDILKLNSTRSKAQRYFKIDADITRHYARNKTGMEFVIEET